MYAVSEHEEGVHDEGGKERAYNLLSMNEDELRLTDDEDKKGQEGSKKNRPELDSRVEDDRVQRPL